MMKSGGEENILVVDSNFNGKHSSSFFSTPPTSSSSSPPPPPLLLQKLKRHPVFSKLAEAGIEVRAHDCIGHGLSVSGKHDSERGLVPRYSFLVDDLRASAAKAAEERPGVPLFLGGHSMGGLIATLTALGGGGGESRDGHGNGNGGGGGGGEKAPSSSSSSSSSSASPSSPSPPPPPPPPPSTLTTGTAPSPPPLPPLPPLSGLFLSSPALDVEWTPILRAQAPVGGLLSLLVPRARVVPAVDPRHLCRDEAVVAAYRADPLCFVGNIRARTANELLRGFRAVAPLAPRLEVPALVIFGDADKIASLPAAQRFVEAAKGGAAKADAELVVFPGAFHEVFHGPDKDKAERVLMEWVEKVSSRKAGGGGGGGRGEKAKM